MAQVSDYYPGDFWGDVKQTLAWLYARQNGPIQGWQGNAVATQITTAYNKKFAQCGIASTPPLLPSPTGAGTFGVGAIENIVIDPPVGVLVDSTVGPDGFPINFSPLGLPQGNILLNTFPNTTAQAVSGRCLNLINAASSYRVDVFSRTDLFYYQGSSSLTDQGSGVYTWSVASAQAGNVIAVLYPTTVAQPGVGSSFANIPAGWVAHSNMGVGQKLTNYKAKIFSKTDIEYLQEDNVPIIVQDAHHARCGSSVIPAAGTMTMHIYTNDPVVGWTQVFTTLQNLAAYKDLPRSLDVPTSDPLFLPDPTTQTAAVIQNRSFIYDCGLAILAYAQAGNFTAASKIIKQLNFFLDNPSYLASLNLETAEDGLTSRWTKSNPGSTVTNLNDPAEPPYGTGNVIKFHSAAAGDVFTYSGAGFPDSTDTMLQFEHREAASLAWVVEIDLTTTPGALVTKILITSDPVGPSTFNSSTKTITVPIGTGADKYRWSLTDLKALVTKFTSDALASITGFKVTLNTAAADFYLDNLSVGTRQPTGSLSFSYDIYNGQIDQAYIRAGAMAWVSYAYALTMAMSLDYSAALYLQSMLNFILTLESTAADLTNGLFRLGYGKYVDPGYQFVPGIQNSVSTEHNVSTYFAFKRAAKVLPTAATQLLKTGAITGAQATSLNSTATTVDSKADQIKTNLLANLYVVPGADPGHFAQGASSGGLDTSQALDASGTWSAVFCHVIADDTKATECLKFVYQKFYLSNQQILKSSISSSYNQAYEQLQTFTGFKPYNDSAGGYSGSPLSVWQEGTWGMIHALLRLYGVQSVKDYFSSVESSIDAFLTKLITGQRVVRSTTGNGSLLNFSLAARGLPWEFNVWPGVASAGWFWLTAINPTLLLATDTDPISLPYLRIPQGQGQSVTEIDGQSSIADLEVEAIDPSGVLKGLAAQSAFVGKVARLKLGFPNMAVGDFVTLHTMQLVSAGWTPEGKVRFEFADVQRFLKTQVWLNGGPAPYQLGTGAAPSQPVGRAWLPNLYPSSDKNPRWVSGNPLDILLAAMQNELGVGQDPMLPSSAWTIYKPADDSTLINPNPYLDVPGVLALRDGAFSGDWFEFKITRPAEGKAWLEDQILKVLGLYVLVGADGKLRLKSMKPPLSSPLTRGGNLGGVAPVMALNERNVLGIPKVSRLRVINVVTVRFGADDTGRETESRLFKDEITFKQQTSIDRYKQQFRHQVEATGLRLARGGALRAYLLADRIFRRHAFGTPQYQVRAFLTAAPVELGDFVWLNHPLVLDLVTGSIGLTNVVCEVVNRQPNYAEGFVELDLLDTRAMSLTTPFQIAKASDNIPTYASASAAQRSQYMFVSFNSTGGLNSDGTPGNTVF